MKLLIAILWFVVFIKKLFLWVWLWQLKEYHMGRFKAHFQTESGRKLIFNYLFTLKLIVLGGLYLNFYSFSYLFFFLLLVESGFALWHYFEKNLKVPVLTKKTYLILAAGSLLGLLLVLAFMIFPELDFYLYLLLIDILTPLLFTGLVFSFEPLAVYWRKKMIREATAKRKKFDKLLVVGITGSYGKTSTKEFLFEILSEKFDVLKTKKHQNSEVGISRCILNELKPEHKVFICEMGAYGKGGIKLLADMAQPKIGILVGINEQHLATFGSLENIIKAKYELIESLPKDGLAIFNGNNKYCVELYEKTENSRKLSTSDIKVTGLKVEKEHISFKVSDGKEKELFKVNLLGEHWVEDILLAFLAAKELGMSLKEIAKACEKIKPLPGAMRLVKTKELNVLEATYSSNFTGVISHLDYLKSWSGKKVIVMPCLIELGFSSEEIHEKIGRKIGEVCDLVIITTRDCIWSIKKGAGAKSKNVLFLSDPYEIYQKIKEFSGKEDVVLLESRVPKELLKILEI